MIASDDVLNATFHALADPTRRAIIQRLALGPATVKDLASPFDMSGPAISKHLRVLERAGLITRGRDAQFRPRAIAAEPIRQVAEWAAGFRALWDARHAALDAYLAQLQREAPPAPPTDHDVSIQGDGYVE